MGDGISVAKFLKQLLKKIINLTLRKTIFIYTEHGYEGHGQR